MNENLSDRYHRKFLIIAADILTAASTLVLAGFFIAGYRELWLIFLVSMIRSIGAGIQASAQAPNRQNYQMQPGD